MDGGSADHAGAVICRHAVEFADADRTARMAGSYMLVQRLPSSS